MTPPEILETERLRLRRPTAADARPLFESYAQDPDVTRYLGWSAHTDLRETREFLARCDDAWEDGTANSYVIERDGDGEPLGMIEIRIRGARVSCGYVLARRHWGQGLMPEAVTALRDWALGQPDLHRFWAVCDVENRGSRRVLEKAGMEREGILRRWEAHPGVSGVPRDVFCYAAVK